MSEYTDQLRYSCQVALPGFGAGGQARIAQARVLIVGMGGLGCPAAQYLVSSGIGIIGLVDFDTVSTSNLHRQILYGPADVGRSKVVVAAEKLGQQNPLVTIIQHAEKITHHNVQLLISDYDLVLDCTDNFDSRYLLNDACVLAGKSLVYGAIYQYEGQVSVWNVLNADGSRSPNYRDLFPEVDASQIPNCAIGGVIPTLAGIIGCMQANEAIKFFTRNPDILAGKLLLFDALSMRSRVIKTGVSTKVLITQLTVAAPVALISVEALALGTDYTLVDVREIAEREADHIGGIHIPLKEIKLRLNEIPMDKDIVFYCASGKRSEEAVMLVNAFFVNRKLYSLQGGLRAVKEENGEL